MDKPKICEVLGVELGQIFYVNGNKCYVSEESGRVMIDYASSPTDYMSGILVCDLINGKIKDVKIPPAFTNVQIEILKMMKNAGIKSIRRSTSGRLGICKQDDDFYQELVFDLFPTIPNDTTINLETFDFEI